VLKLFSLLFFFINLANADEFLNLTQAPLAQERIKIKASDFNIQIKNNKTLKIQTLLDKTSIEWVRVKETLLVPRARLKIRIKNPKNLLYIQYKDQIHNFQKSKNYIYAELNISLFENQQIKILSKSNELAQIIVLPKKRKKSRVLVDYSCSRNGINIKGLSGEHFSIGCHTKPVGKFGEERPMLEINWISPELQIVGTKLVPYHAAFLNKFPIKVKVLNIVTNKEKTITITAKIPKRLHRLFTAYGFGPYAFDTKTKNEQGDRVEKSEPMAPALFFYLNYKMSDTTSIRGFDAAVFKESKFNNAGAYFGNDFGFSFDKKLYFTSLIGVQYLYFQFDSDSTIISQPIFPQGLEFMYRHAFDIPNYIISGGVFLSPSDNIEYRNVWVRWGKNYFWELNLIEWGQDDFKASMWGLSVGFPFKGFL
jgi:hypothetical protein